MANGDVFRDAAYEGDEKTVLSFCRLPRFNISSGKGDERLWTALMWAVEGGRANIARLLLSFGANTESVNKKYSHTALTMAIANGHIEMVNLLLTSKANPNHRIRHQGFTALHLAVNRSPLSCKESIDEIVFALIRAGADIYAVDRSGQPCYSSEKQLKLFSYLKRKSFLDFIYASSFRSLPSNSKCSASSKKWPENLLDTQNSNNFEDKKTALKLSAETKVLSNLDLIICILLFM